MPGIPNGLPTTATIGTTGGTLASSDGLLTITAPPGALPSGTAVTIQPITGTAPGALGSYRLTPEGVTFAQPVTLTFTYSADEAVATEPQSLRVATRDARGYWVVTPSVHNAAQRTLTVTTTHFSDWSRVAGVQIRPASATVEVNKQLQLEVIDCVVSADPDAGDELPRLLYECIDDELRPLTRNWSVNGTAGGNSTIGTIAGGTYSAPAAQPGQNPVAVSAQYGQAGGRLVTLVSNVTVVDYPALYTGTIFGRTTVTVGNQTGFHELNATVRFTRNTDLSVGGAKWYDGTGTATVRARPLGCSGEGSGSAPVQAANLVLYTEGPLAGTYTVSVGTVATITVQCGDPPQSTSAPVPAVAGAAGNGTCPSLQIGSDPNRLAGSWLCNDGAGIHSSNWTFAKSTAGQAMRHPF